MDTPRMRSAKSKLEKEIPSQRIRILQEYLFLYGARLKGEESLHELFDADEIELSSEDGEAYMESIMDVEMYERQLAGLMTKLKRLYARSHKDE